MWEFFGVNNSTVVDASFHVLLKFSFATTQTHICGAIGHSTVAVFHKLLSRNHQTLKVASKLVSSNCNNQNPFRLVQIQIISSYYYEIRLKWWILTPLMRKWKVFLRQSIISGFITLLFVTQPPSSVL